MSRLSVANVRTRWAAAVAEPAVGRKAALPVLAPGVDTGSGSPDVVKIGDEGAVLTADLDSAVSFRRLRPPPLGCPAARAGAGT